MSTSPGTPKQEDKPALPWYGAGDEVAPKLAVDGDAVKLDALGPIVVNSDGTISRIANWVEMSEIERRNVMRILPKRNRERIEELKTAGIDVKGF